jgi:hypothetical protein
LPASVRLFSALALLADLRLSDPARDAIVPPSAAIVLRDGSGFFVLGSDFPVRIGAPDAAWLQVEPVDEARTDPRVVALRVGGSALGPGRHDISLSIEVITGAGREELLLPIVACVGDSACATANAGRARVRLADPFADVRAGLTPAGHLLLEIVDRERERREVAEVRASRVPEPREPRRPPRTERPTLPLPGFPVVLPWMCLEYPCGSSTAADVADVAKGLDAVNAVSY